jgi:hypothetical protein
MVASKNLLQRKNSIMDKNLDNEQSKRIRQDFFPLGSGVVLGIVLGTALGNIAIGLVVGIILGGIVVIWRKKK